MATNKQNTNNGEPVLLDIVSVAKFFPTAQAPRAQVQVILNRTIGIFLLRDAAFIGNIVYVYVVYAETKYVYVVNSVGNNLAQASPVAAFIASPSQPPLKTKPNNCYVAKLVEPYCHCDFHLYEPEMGRYMKLAEKEKALYQELDNLKKRMAVLVSDILDHPCDTDDEKMKTIYETDYVKRGLNLVQYRKLIPAIDSPVGIPVKSETIGLGTGYRDPTRFRYSELQKPFIDVCQPVMFTRTPTLVDEWFAPRTGSTEYHDAYSKIGLNILKSSQQYAEPLPSSRRKADDRCA